LWSDQRFDYIVKRALVGSNHQERYDWNVAFRSTRNLWRAAYERAIDWEYRLDLTLLERLKDEPEPERRFVLIA
jgi:hypothetical protein